MPTTRGCVPSTRSSAPRSSPSVRPPTSRPSSGSGSAMGGTLASRMQTPELEWEHLTALGRDHVSVVQQRGVIYPFGFPAVIVDTAVPRISGDTAALHQESVLRVTAPVRQDAIGRIAVGPRVPLGTVELLTPTLPGLAAFRGDHVRPPDRRTRGARRIRGGHRRSAEQPRDEARGCSALRRWPIRMRRAPRVRRSGGRT